MGGVTPPFYFLSFNSTTVSTCMRAAMETNGNQYRISSQGSCIPFFSLHVLLVPFKISRQVAKYFAIFPKNLRVHLRLGTGTCIRFACRA